MEAATDTAVSKSSGSAYDGALASSTTVMWLRRVSWYCRIWRVLALADDRQCTCLRSSPGTYSRNAWKARSLIEISSLGVPSWSRITPMPRDSTGTIRGSTSRSTAGDQVSCQLSSANGSPRRAVTGPTGTTPRRSPVSSICSSIWRPLRSIGSRIRCSAVPTGSAMSGLGIGSRRALLARSAPGRRHPPSSVAA